LLQLWPNEFGEAEPGLHYASLFALGLALFAITFVVLAIAKIMLARMESRAREKDMMNNVNQAIYGKRKRSNWIGLTLFNAFNGIGYGVLALDFEYSLSIKDSRPLT